MKNHWLIDNAFLLSLSTLRACVVFAFVKGKNRTRVPMRTPASSLVSKLRPIYSSKGRWVGTMTPRKQINDKTGEGCMKKDEAEPIAAFSRPPPLSPFLGPLVALSMLDSWFKQDNNDN